LEEAAMSDIEHPGENTHSGIWAQPVDTLDAGDAPEGLTAINIQGRRAIGALQGFGQLWKKTYKVRLTGVKHSTMEVMQVWKENFALFQPPGNRFYLPSDGVTPGKIMWIDSPLPVAPPFYDKPGIVPMTSGVVILYADDESFSVMTPEGFPVSGWNNFSVFEEDGSLVAQVQSFERASDPIYEFGFRFMGGAARQEFIWTNVLTRLAEHLGVKSQVTMARECLDASIQWAYTGRVLQNAGVRTTLYKAAAPIRWVLSLFRGS
jgi:hypothetical protein